MYKRLKNIITIKALNIQIGILNTIHVFFFQKNTLDTSIIVICKIAQNFLQTNWQFVPILWAMP